MRLSKNQENMPSKNPEMESLKQSLVDEFPDIEIFKLGPASKPYAEKTNVVWNVWNYFYLKWFTKTGKILWKTEHELINLFNDFSEKCNNKFSWPDVSEIWETEDGWYYFLMKDAKHWGLEELDFSKMSPEEIMELYSKYRQTFDDFEKYSKWKTSTESNSTLQKIYSLSKNYKDSLLFNFVWNPLLKLAVSKKYNSKINERITNGQDVVRACDIDVDREKLIKTLDKLLSKVEKMDFEYVFWRLWTWHVFSDGEIYKLVDFDNVSYQIRWTEAIGTMWSNLLIWVQNYESFEGWKKVFDGWCNKLVEIYGDNDLVKLLLFVKLVWTVFEDYGHLIYERDFLWKDESFDEIKKWIEWNYRVLQELMDKI